jgi:hypothetical protein
MKSKIEKFSLKIFGKILNSRKQIVYSHSSLYILRSSKKYEKTHSRFGAF